MSENQPRKEKAKRNRIFAFLAVLFVASGSGYALYQHFYGRFYETTDNAYVKQQIVYVTPQIGGTVDEVYVSETQPVKAGERVGRLDTRDARLAFEAAKAQLAETVRRVEKLYREKDEADASIVLARTQLERAEGNLRRRQDLARSGAISAEDYAHTKQAYKQAKEQLDVIRRKASTLAAVVRKGRIEDNPDVRVAEVEVMRRYLDLRRCDIIAPLSGVVARKSFSVGSRVAEGATVMAIVPEKGFWVDANFKETQLRHIRIGQPVTLTSDMYGKKVKFHGKVLGISPGTGAVFSLLPAQNATGNWIKIVQRIPVRIALRPSELKAHVLHVGNSMTATVDTHDRSGPQLRGALPTHPEISAPLYADAHKVAKTIAERIIRQNL